MSELPSLIQQAKNLTVAYAKWLAAGRPVRTPDQINALYDICEQCPTKRFTRSSLDKGRCSACGCWLKRGADKFNKLAWPTEACPDGHWSNEVEPEPINFDELEDDC
jgi:hypothetical protein